LGRYHIGGTKGGELMSLEKIKFNPYKELSHDEIITIIEDFIDNTNNPETVLLELSNKIYYDNSIGWRMPLIFIFSRYDSLVKNIENYFLEMVEGKKKECLPQILNLVTILVSEKIIDTKFLSKEIIHRIESEEAKNILFSFLVTWELNKAIELDNIYVQRYFSHVIEANKIPIKELIFQANEDAYFNVITAILGNPITHYYFNQKILEIIKKEEPSELQQLEKFIEKCSKSKINHVSEFFLDLLEIKTVRDLLENIWENSVTERLYKNFKYKNNEFMEISKTRALNSINKLKNRLNSNFYVAARYEINKLSENDKLFIYDKVTEIVNQKIDNFFGNFTIEINSTWDWKDYAHDLLLKYIALYGEDSIFDIRKLSCELGIDIIENRFETENFDACLIRDNTLKSPIIFINTNKKSKGRINFSIAHEIAHAVLPHHAQKNYFCYLNDINEANRIRMDKHLEIEANNFASYILLPDRQFKTDINRRNFSIENVQALSEKYQVSLVLIAKKWVELSNLEIAMLVSTGGIVDWWITSESFPYKWIDTNVEFDSTIYKAIENQEVRSYKKIVSSTKWSNPNLPEIKLLEETRKIFDDKALTILQVNDEE
jgi:Zn-dependent peptidase ImmA (M78 family)